MRVEAGGLAEGLHGLEVLLPVLVVYAAAVYCVFGMHRNKWRFTSVPDLYNIFRAATFMAA